MTGARIAVVTGASGGIGGALAAALAAEGATVHALSRRRPEGSERVIWHRADFEDDASVSAVAAALAETLPRLDLLAHAAGFYATGQIGEAPLSDIDRLWRVNLRAPWALTRALLPALVAARGAALFVNSSVWGAARAGLGGYAAAKFALKAMADALRDEVNEAGVRVLSVYPGRTASAMQAAIHETEGRPYRPGLLLQPGDVAAAALSALALPETAEVTDLHLRPARRQR